jgi:transcriptional regulator with XRE-family HTH domain
MLQTNQPPPTFSAEWLKSLRKENNLTQAGLGQLLRVSQTTVALWERGEYEPDAAQYAFLLNLADRTPTASGIADTDSARRNFCSHGTTECWRCRATNPH